MKSELAKNLDVSKLSYTAIKLGKNGGKVVGLNYNGAPLAIQLPKDMKIPFGANDYNGNKKFVVNFAFDLSNPQHKNVFDRLSELDEKLINDACNSDWFDQKRSLDGIRDGFQSQIKTNPKYDPTLKCGLPLSVGGDFRTNFIDENNNKVDVNQSNLVSQIPPHSRGTAVIECAGIWIVQKTLTLTWKLSTLKYTTANNGGYEIDDEEDEATEEEEYKVVNKPGELVSDSDDEGEVIKPKRITRVKKSVAAI